MCGKDRPILVTVAASDPILLAVAHGEFALASRDHISTAKTDLDQPDSDKPGALAAAAMCSPGLLYRVNAHNQTRSRYHVRE
jgi:hypothetical protein